MRVAIMLALSSLACASAIAAQIPNSSFRAGRWDVGAYNSDDGGFSHCAAISSQAKSTLLLFSQSADGSFYIAFMRPSWNLTVGKRYTVSLSLDGANWGADDAATYDTNAIRIGPLDQERIAALRVGSKLKLSSGSEQIQVSLEDSRQAIDAVARCVARFAPATQTHAVTTSPSSEPDAQSETEKQARELMSALLEQAGVSGTAWADTASVGYKKAVVGWRGSTLEGALYVKQGDMSQMAIDLRTKQGEACKGTFIATNPVSEVAGDTDVKSYEFLCEEGETTSGFAIVEVEDHSGKSNLLLVNDTNGKDNVAALLSVNAKLRKLLVQLNKKDTT